MGQSKEGSASVCERSNSSEAYPMNIFKFPTTLCKEIDSILAGFWWGKTRDKQKLHWINWDTLGEPKQEGGMGFCNLQEFNLALLAKQCWRISMEPQSMWVKVLKGRYFPNIWKDRCKAVLEHLPPHQLELFTVPLLPSMNSLAPLSMADIKRSLRLSLTKTSNIFGTPLPLLLSRLTWMHHGIQTQRRLALVS
ncbi:unnamed protein product [Prunus brigantina]